MPNGLFHAEYSSEQQRVKQGDSWLPVDLSLMTGPAGLSPKVTPTPIVFSTGGGTLLATVRPSTMAAVTETWPTGRLPRPIVSGAKATYPNIYPGVDLALTATLDGFSEVLVVKTPAAAASAALASVRFGVSSPGARATSVAGGQELHTPSGQKLRIGTATWWDSSYPDASTRGPGGPGLAKYVPDQYDPTMLRLNAGSIGRTAGLTYPLYIDPTYQSFQGGVQGWTYVDTAGPNTSNWKGTGSDAYAHVGYIDSAHGGGANGIKARSFWQLNTHGLEGKKVYSAEFNVSEVWASSCAAWPVEFWTSAAVSSATTWNNQPTPSTHMESPSFAWNWSSAGIGGASGCARSTPVGFNALYAAQAAASRNYASVTVELKTSETDWRSWKKFTGAATLDVDYDTVPNVPAGRYTSVTSACVIGSGRPVVGTTTPTLYAVGSDPDRTTLSLQFEWWNTGGSSAVGSVTTAAAASGSRFQAAVPAHAFASGANMSWRVRAWDGLEWSGYTTWCELHLDTDKPPTPGVSSPITDFPTADDLTAAGLGASNPPKKAGDSGNVTFNNGGASDVRQFHYSLNGRPWSTAATPTGAAVTVAIDPGLPTNDLAVYSTDQANNQSPTFDYVFQVKKNDLLVANWNFGTDPVNNQIPMASTAGSNVPLNLKAGLAPAASSNGPTTRFDGSEGFVYDFDGVDANAQTDAAVLNTANSFAVGFRAKPVSATGTQTVVSQWGTSTNSYALAFVNGMMQFRISNADTGNSLVASATVSTGSLASCGYQTTDPNSAGYFDLTGWHTWVAAWDMSDKLLMLYVDACQDPVVQATSGFATWQGTGPTTVAAALGGPGALTNYLKGSISQLMMFTGVPTPDEIADQIGSNNA